MGCLSSTNIYADTGVGKTALAGAWARWVNKVTGKKVRMYTAEPGGLGTIQDEIDEGIIDVWDISTRANPTETLDFASVGYWPDSSDPNKLVAPDVETFKTYGGFIHEGATAYGELLLEELRIKGAANEIVGAEAAPQATINRIMESPSQELDALLMLANDFPSTFSGQLGNLKYATRMIQRSSTIMDRSLQVARQRS
jgi:hypothetical protein